MINLGTLVLSVWTLYLIKEESDYIVFEKEAF